MSQFGAPLLVVQISRGVASLEKFFRERGVLRRWRVRLTDQRLWIEKGVSQTPWLNARRPRYISKFRHENVEHAVMLATFMKYLCHALILEHALQVPLFPRVNLLP